MKELTLTRPGTRGSCSDSQASSPHKDTPGRAPHWRRRRRWFEIDDIIEVCEHKNTEWIPAEPENNVVEDMICLDCDEQLPMEFDHAEI